MKEHPELEYWIIGDGELREEIESVIDTLDLKDKSEITRMEKSRRNH
jgi:hypothetical protein